MPPQKPILVVSGFLGAGKTTLIRNLLAEFARCGVMADLILNDIANAEPDAASIPPDQAASVSPLAASCACCESLDDLITLCRTAARGSGDLLIIELNGTADPLRLLESFALLRERLPFSPVLQVSAIDVRHWGERGELTALEARQMRSAGLHVLTHTDRSPESDVRAVEKSIVNAFPDSRRVTPGQLANALVTSSPLPKAILPPPDRPEHDPVHLLSHQVTGCQVPLPPKVRRAAIERLLTMLPEPVLRAKAIVKLVEQPGTRWLFERSGRELSPTPIPIPNIANLSPSLLCMGLHLDPGPIRALVSEEFGIATPPLSPNPYTTEDDHLRLRNHC